MAYSQNLRHRHDSAARARCNAHLHACGSGMRRRSRQLTRRKTKGSSLNPGERGADLEEEVLLVAVPVSAALD
ncbi:hypothetical protein, partial [Burkholderia pseudomallei]|uniref:hypothetical protein n=1 Tax=Burkholderia pseudomallei TaxID=28450 RepID=UPI001177B53F